MKRATLTLLAVALGALLLWLWWPDAGRAPDVDGGASTVDRSSAQGGPDGVSAPVTPVDVELTTDDADLLPRQVVIPGSPPTARLTVRVRCGGLPPPAGLAVLVSSVPLVDAWRDERSTPTDDDGLATFALSPGTYRCRTALGGAGTFTIGAEEHRELPLDLPAGMRLDGRVVDERGEPIAGADVLALMAGDLERAFPLARSDDDGRFRAVGLGARTWLAARHPEFAPSVPQRFVPDGALLTGVEIVLRHERGRVRGLVTDADGRSVADAWILIGGDLAAAADLPAASPPRHPARSDVQGRFLTPPLPPGLHRVEAWATGCGLASGTVRVDAGVDADLRIQLLPGATVHGVVRDANGAPVPRAFVFGGERGALGSQLTTTDELGRYRLQDLAVGAVEVSAVRAPAGSARTERANDVLQLSSGRETEWNPTLAFTDDGSVHGVVEDDAGRPLPGFHIVATPLGGRRGRGTVSAADGSFAIAGLPTSGEVMLTARRPGGGWTGFPDATLGPVSLQAEDAVVLRVGDLEMGRGTLVGRVVEAGAGGVTAIVQLRAGRTGTTAEYRTEADGRFRIDGVPAGDLQAAVRLKGHPDLRLEPFALPPGTIVDLGDLELGTGAAVFGRLLWPPGHEPSNVQVSVVDDGENDAGLADASSTGYRTPLLRSGTYTLLVQGDDVAAMRVPVTIGTGADIERNIQLTVGSVHRIRVTSRRPEHAEAMTSIVLVGGDGRPVWSAHLRMQHGVAEFRACLPQGTYDAIALGIDGYRTRGRFSVVPSGPTHAETVLELQPPQPR